MSSTQEIPDYLTLGKQVASPQTPDEARLDPVPWRNPLADALPPPCFRYSCPEFTSLCPATGQPDFAHITIDYIPKSLLVESKSFKLFMASFRNHRAFHEVTTLLIAERFMRCADPLWLRITGIWFPRGGIPIDVFWQSGHASPDVMVPEIDYKHYRGR